jgi:hypothetical protein
MWSLTWLQLLAVAVNALSGWHVVLGLNNSNYLFHQSEQRTVVNVKGPF